MLRTAPVPGPMSTFTGLPRKILGDSLGGPLSQALSRLSAGLEHPWVSPSRSLLAPALLCLSCSSTHTPHSPDSSRESPQPLYRASARPRPRPLLAAEVPETGRAARSASPAAHPAAAGGRTWWRRPLLPGLLGAPSPLRSPPILLNPSLPSGDVRGGRGQAGQPPDFPEVLPFAEPVNVLS